MDKRILEAKKLLESGNLPESRVLVEEILKEHPSDPAARNLLGLIYFQLEDYNESINIFRDLVEEYPNEVPLLVNLGLAYLKKGDSLEAVRVLEKAVRLNPHHRKAYNYLGLSYANLNLYQKARDAFKLGDSPRMVEKMEGILTSLTPEVEEKGQSFEEVVVSSKEEEFSKELSTTSSEISRDKLDKLLNTIEVISDEEGIKYPGKDLDKVGEEGSIRVVDNLVICSLELGPCFSVVKDILIRSGDIEFMPKYKKYKGKELKTYFSSAHGIIHEISGNGGKVIFNPSKNVHFFSLTGDFPFYFHERLVYAFSGELKWENGRLPSPGEGDDLYLVQFRGEGSVVVVTDGEVYKLSLEEEPIYLPLNSFIGWGGDILPAFVEDSAGNFQVELSGKGVVFFKVE